MKLRFLVAALALCFSAGAFAQGGLYFNPIVTIVHNSVADTGPFAFLGEGQKQQVFGGVVFGGYYEVYHAPRFNISLDLRDEIEHGNNASLNNLLFGVRATYVAHESTMKPYLHVAFGDGRTASPLNPIHISKAEYAILAGVDRPINRVIDWRIAEVGYGSVTTVSSAVFSGPIAVPAATLIQFSTGFVFRIP